MVTESSATTHDTVDEIVRGSKRQAVPLRRSFIQQKSGRASLPGPLAPFVSARDRIGLLLYLLTLTRASHKPWDVSLHSAVWARALGLPEPTTDYTRTRVSKAWGRLERKKLVKRSRYHRLAKVTLLREDGSGYPYSSPRTRYVKIPLELWTEGPEPSKRWFEALTLPELAFLIIGLSNADDFSLPAERGPDYYGLSADTIQRGSARLRERKLLARRMASLNAPLSPTGITLENRYTLRSPFGPKGVASKRTGGVQ